MRSRKLVRRIENLAGGIAGLVDAWHDFGWEKPPVPGCKPIPPLGERSADAIRAGHMAVEEIDGLRRRLYALRQELSGRTRTR